MKELRLQDKIIKSAKKFGGHARKWSSSFQVGMPDLIMTLPLYGVFLAEVKIINVGDNHHHAPTKKQVHEMNKWVTGGGVAVLLYGIADGPRVYLAGCPYDTEVTLDTYEEFAWVLWGRRGFFDLPELIENMKELKHWPNQ